MLGVLRRNPQFRRLWTAQLVSQTGDWFSRTAVLGLLSSLGARGAMVGVGALYAVELATRLLPSALFFPLAGSAADRLPRRLLLVVSDLVRAGVVLAILLVREPGDLPLLYGLIVVQVALGTFFSCAQSGAIPSTIGRGELHDAYALTSATWSFTLSLGAFLGGVVVHHFGGARAIQLDALSYLVSASFLRGLKLPPVMRHPERFRLSDSLLFADLRRGLAHARERGALLVLSTKTFWGGAGGYLVLLSLLASERFAARGADGVPLPDSVGAIVGLLYAARGVGTGLGPVLVRLLAGSSDATLRRQIAGGFAVGAAGYALIPFAPSLPVAFLCIAFAHAGGSTLWVASTTFWQRRVDDGFRGRIFSLEFLGMTVSFAAGGAVAAVVYDHTGDLRTTIWASCALVLLGGATWVVLALLHPGSGRRRPVPEAAPTETSGVRR